MAVLPIRLFPDPILRRKSLAVSIPNKALEKVLKDLWDTLRAQPDGIGIAAPQIGIPLRIAIVDISARNPTKKTIILINPVIRQAEKEVLRKEGCMSLPEYTALVRRPTRVLAEWLSLEGKVCSRWFEGLEAICVQHEVDHLEGRLFVDRVACLRTDVLPRGR